MDRDTLINDINQIIGLDLLAKAAKNDERANGVQVLGSAAVNKVAFGVSCNLAFLEKATEWGAQLCVFHHGLDIQTYKSRFPMYHQKRLRLIFQHDLSILGFHYALDAHPKIGNNARIIQELDGQINDTLFHEWGFVAELSQSVRSHELRVKIEDILGRKIFHFGDKNREIGRIGVVTGAAKPNAEELEEMKAKGVQLYISGETSEATPHMMLEEGIDYFVCGHYASETFGVKALFESLKEKQPKLDLKFIDIPNPV